MKPLLFLVSAALLQAQSPVAKSPNVPIDNEYVRVVLATDRPVAKPGPQHEHKSNRVMIYLDSGDIQIKYADGKVENQHWKSGDVAWSPASGLHTSQNVSAQPVRIVEIEVKSPGASQVSSVGRSSSLLDNAQVRVYRGTEAPKSGHYVAVNTANVSAVWDKLPEGSGPFVITEIK